MRSRIQSGKLLEVVNLRDTPQLDQCMRNEAPNIPFCVCAYALLTTSAVVYNLSTDAFPFFTMHNRRKTLLSFLADPHDTIALLVQDGRYICETQRMRHAHLLQKTHRILGLLR